MASNGYPKIPSKAWRTLRSRAAAAPSTKFTPANVAALLQMASPESARDNVVSALRRVGLIEEDGALTDRGNLWRVDASYATACEQIVADVYPEELSLLTGADGRPDLQAVKTWLDHKRFGDSNARQMAATYVMIASKDLPEAVVAEPRKPTAKKQSNASKAVLSREPNAARRADSAPERAERAEESQLVHHSAAVSPGPNVHLDIQIHIPADANLEQIDQIFASMAKHLYQR